MKNSARVVWGLIFGMLAVLYLPLSAYVEHGEQLDILERAGKVPEDLKNKLDELFAKDTTDLYWLLFLRARLPNRDLDQRDNALMMNEMKEMEAKSAREIGKDGKIAGTLTEKIFKENKIDVISAKHSFVLQLPTIPEYIFRYNLFETTSRFQNVSRVFYNEKIRDFIQREGLDRIATVRMWLYNIPGRSPFSVNDDSYAVIAEHFKYLVGFTEGITWEEFTARLKKKDEEAHTILAQMTRVIIEAAIWSANERDIIFINERGVLKALFLDTEQPPLGAAEDKNFFFKSDEQVRGNMIAGVKALKTILNKYGYTLPEKYERVE